MPADDVRQIFRRHALKLEHELRAPGDVLDHRSTVGHVREDAVAAALRAHTLQDISTKRGQIRSPSAGPTSEWDIVITESGVAGLAGISSAIPIEQVLAVVSVKSRLDSAAIAECVQAGTQLRGLVEQRAPHRPVPPVFAFGLDGISADSLLQSLLKAVDGSGGAGAVDGALVLGSYTILPNGLSYIVQEDEDAYGRWVAAVDSAVLSAPRRQVTLAPYLSGLTGPDDADEPDGGSAALGAPLPRGPGGGSTGLTLRPRRQRADVSASRTVALIVSELAKSDASASAQLQHNLAHIDQIERLAPEARGPFGLALARILSLADRDEAAASLFERVASDPGVDKPRALINAARIRESLGEVREAERLRQAASDADPTSAVVRLEQARHQENPEAILAALAPVPVATGRDRARRAVLRGEALSELDRDHEAVEEARAALSDFWAPDLAERLAILLLRTAGPAPPPGEEGHDLLVEAAMVLDELIDEMLALDQPGVAMRLEARLVAALMRLGRHDLVSRVAAVWASRDDVVDVDARTELAAALIAGPAVDAAREIAPSPLPDSALGRVLAVRLALTSEERPDNLHVAVAHLDDLVAAPETPAHERMEAAEARAQAAADGGAPWSDEAARVIGERSPFYRDLLHAHALEAEGRRESAEALLLKYADKPEGVRALVDLAARADRWDRVVRLIEDALGHEAPVAERLRLAQALRQLGKLDEAEPVLRDVATRSDSSESQSEEAWLRLCELQTELQQWDKLAGIAQQWYSHRTTSALAIWVAADALARTGHERQAWALIEQDGRDPTTSTQRRLIAQLASRVLDVPEALALIVRLSDSVQRSDELLEALLITTAVRDDKSELSPVLETRVRQTFADFPERFPNSKIVQQVRAPTSEEDWARFADEYLRSRRELAEELERDVTRGEMPLASLGALGGSALSVWLDAGMLPMVAPIPEIAGADLATAEAAIAGPAVWDASVLAVLSLLDGRVADVLTRAIPASSTSRAVMEEVRGLGELVHERDPVRSPGTLTVVDGKPAILQRSVEIHSALSLRAARIAKIAQGLAVVDPDLSEQSELAAMLRDGDLHEAGSSWTSAMLLARQRKVPLFCDDRVTRRMAAGLEIPSFGTVALLHAAVARKLLTEAEARESLWRLRAAGARSLPAEVEEIAEQLEASQFRISAEVSSLLKDPDEWGLRPSESFTRLHEVLLRIWSASPDQLDAWVRHAVTQVALTLNKSRRTVASLLVLPALGVGTRNVHYVRELTAAMRRCNLEAFDVGDPLAAAMVRLAASTDPAERDVAVWTWIRALSCMPVSEQIRILDLMQP